MRPQLSIVIPIFNEEEVLPELERRLGDFLAGQEKLGGSWEVVFINDGSRDRSLDMLRELSKRESRYKVISFSRNFGHQLAITAGVDRAEGEAVVIIDADLQDPPEVIAQMLERFHDGFDVVYGVRAKRKGETLFKRATAAMFYRILRAFTGVEIPVDAGDFRLMSRPVILTLRALRERHRFVRGMVAWVGFRQTAVHYQRDERFAGETKYPFHKMVRFAIDAITSFSILPLRFAVWFGLIAGLFAFGVAGWSLYVKFFLQGVVPGWTTIMIMVALASSVQLVVMGVLGEYVGRAYEELKRRPLYITAEELNLEQKGPPSSLRPGDPPGPAQ